MNRDLRAGFRGDEGRPFGVSFQEWASNYLKRLWSRAMVVSVEEKSNKISASKKQKDE